VKASASLRGSVVNGGEGQTIEYQSERRNILNRVLYCSRVVHPCAPADERAARCALRASNTLKGGGAADLHSVTLAKLNTGRHVANMY
jgi:hypothetical protein